VKDADKARCTWNQLEDQSGDMRVLEADSSGPALVHRFSMGRVQVWRRVMVGGKDQALFELVSWGKKRPAR
jgi:hypothetical protein